MACVFLSFGSNLGDRVTQIGAAMEELLKRAGTFIKISAFYETEPWGKKDQPWFLNACVQLQTELPPEELLKICQTIEQKAGRMPKHEKWGPRFLDIDILFYDYVILNLFQDPHEMLKQVQHDNFIQEDNPSLQIPHPEIQRRRFILAPLAEIAPNFIHPVLKKNISQLLKECADPSIVKPR